MLRSKLIVPALSAVCLLASQAMIPVAFASPVRSSDPVHAFVGTKMVKLHLTNSSAEPLKIQVGDQAMTVEVGKTVDLNLAVGTKIINVEATKTHAAGEVLSQVSSSLSGATLKVS